MKIYIIGCGGVGSFLAPTMCLLAGAKNIVLVDGDTLEKKNLNRQLFTEADIGNNKAAALAAKYECDFIPDWYSESLIAHDYNDWLLGVVDNHIARRAILTATDFAGCSAIFGANEVHSSEAFVYRSGWIGTKNDPRIMYPEIMTDNTNDPRRGAIGCTGEAQAANVQLVTANFMAAALVAHLYVLWGMEARKTDKETQQHYPHKLVQNLTRNEFFKSGQLQNQTNQNV